MANSNRLIRAIFALGVVGVSALSASAAKAHVSPHTHIHSDPAKTTPSLSSSLDESTSSSYGLVDRIGVGEEPENELLRKFKFRLGGERLNLTIEYEDDK